MHLPSTPRRPRPTPANVRLLRSPFGPRSGRWRVGLVLPIVLVSLALSTMALPSASASSPAALAHSTAGDATGSAATACGPAPASGSSGAGAGPSGPCGTWAWGAAANLTAGLEFEGAYNASQFLTGGALTTQGAYIDLEASLEAEWATYSIVNASSSAPGQLFVSYQAGDLLDVDLSVVAQGTLPEAGTYAPTSNVTLAPMNVSLVAHVKIVDRYEAFLNLSTDANGSLALENEDLQFFRTVDVSLNAVNFPNATAGPNGTTNLQYISGDLQAEAEVEAQVQGSFTPAIVLVRAPVRVGESWTSSSQAQFQGEEESSLTASGVAPNGEPFSVSQTGEANAGGSFPLVLSFAVVGERTVYFPNGGSETDYVISCEGNGGASLFDGLLLVPTEVLSDTGGAQSAVDAHPASQEVASSTSTPSRPLYSTDKRMPDSSDATPVSGQTVTGAPMTPQRAQDLLNGLGGLSPITFGPTSDPWVVVAITGAAIVVGVFALRTVLRVRRERAW